MTDLAAGMPSSLVRQARWERVAGGIPALLVHPTWAPEDRRPLVIWMHGRTVTKEIDPGRYLRLMRAGLAVCAVDLPGHGERRDEALQDTRRTFEVVQTMVDELDEIVAAVGDRPGFRADRVAIGGMSAGGMAALARLTRPHGFQCASVEATSGSWSHQRHRAMFDDVARECIDDLDPIGHLDRWREIPLQAIHSKLDEWMAYDGQREFIDALRSRYAAPETVDFVTFESTGAPFEHAGFGRMASEAKNAQRDFLARWLLEESDQATKRPSD
jgi:dienelactone hydrolase